MSPADALRQQAQQLVEVNDSLDQAQAIYLALRALADERDKLKAERQAILRSVFEQQSRADAALADATRLREALEQAETTALRIADYADRCTFYGPADALRDRLTRLLLQLAAALRAEAGTPQHEPQP